MKSIRLVVLTITALAISSMAFSAQDSEAIGQIILSVGNVQAISAVDNARDLTRRDKIYEDETITTGNNSHVKLRFNDNTILSLDPDTEFFIDEYKFDSSDPDNNKYLGKLIKGGFMVVTGAVANKDKANFKVDSELLGLTVRGTCFGGSLGDDFQFSETTCGAVQVDNKYGSVLVGPKQTRNLVVSGQDGSLLTAVDKAQAGKITQCDF